MTYTCERAIRNADGSCTFCEEAGTIAWFGTLNDTVEFGDIESLENSFGEGIVVTSCESCYYEMQDEFVTITSYADIASALINHDFSGILYEAEESNDNSMVELAESILADYNVLGSSYEGWFGDPTSGFGDEPGYVINYTLESRR